MAGSSEPARIRLEDILFDPWTESQTIEAILGAIQAGQGGWVVTPNTDIARAVAHDPSLRALVASADVVIADGMPLIWASRIEGRPLPERVTGASLIRSLTKAAARRGTSVYFLGGAPGVPEQAAERLRADVGAIVAGSFSPACGFECSSAAMEEITAKLRAAQPGIVFCGFGFPKQERLIVSLRLEFADTWFVGCGAAIAFAAGAVDRAPQWMQRHGLEWAFRLASEPRRLARRYLVHDAPYAVALLGRAALARLRAKGAVRAG